MPADPKTYRLFLRQVSPINRIWREWQLKFDAEREKTKRDLSDAALPSFDLLLSEFENGRCFPSKRAIALDSLNVISAEEGLFVVEYQYLLLACLLGFIPALIARSKGHDAFFMWWLYGTAIFIIAFPHALFMKRLQTAAEIKQLGKRPCPHCAEEIQPKAQICPFCRLDVVQMTACRECNRAIDLSVKYCPYCSAPREEQFMM